MTGGNKTTPLVRLYIEGATLQRPAVSGCPLFSQHATIVLWHTDVCQEKLRAAAIVAGVWSFNGQMNDSIWPDAARLKVTGRWRVTRGCVDACLFDHHKSTSVNLMVALEDQQTDITITLSVHLQKWSISLLMQIGFPLPFYCVCG